MARSKAHAIARNYTLWQTENIEPDIFRASKTETANGIDFWDALIETAAAKGGDRQLRSEDLTDGQVIAGVAVKNPFLNAEPSQTSRWSTSS